VSVTNGDWFAVDAERGPWVNRNQIVKVSLVPLPGGWRVLAQLSDGKPEVTIGERATWEEALELRSDLMGLVEYIGW